MDQKRLAALLRKLNKSAISSLGTIPLERLVAKNLDDLSTLRSSGITWNSIARALVDWRRKDNLPLSVDHLRSAYSRARRHNGLEVRSTGQVASQPDPQDTECTLSVSRGSQTTLSASDRLKPAGNLSQLRTQTSRTLRLRNIEED